MVGAAKTTVVCESSLTDFTDSRSYRDNHYKYYKEDQQVRHALGREGTAQFRYAVIRPQSAASSKWSFHFPQADLSGVGASATADSGPQLFAEREIRYTPRPGKQEDL
jgi:hypothetical protein